LKHIMNKEESAQQNIGEPQKASKPKRRNYKKELQKALEELAELKDQLLRTAAEFDNFRKRTQNEKRELISHANADFVAELLPVLDDFDRFFQLGKISDADVMRDGIDMIHKKLQKVLSDRGLSGMESVGQSFDPEKHEALMQVEAKGVESDVVIEEHEKGYEFNGRVLRHAKVIVSK